MKPHILVIAVLIGLLAFLQYKLWLSPEGLSQYWQLKSNVAQSAQENNQLQARNDHVKAEVDDLKNGDEAIEEHARDELGLIKPDETFYQIVK